MVVSGFDLGYFDYQQPEDLSTLPVFSMANWDYEECGTGVNPFGPNYDTMNMFIATWSGPESGPGYAHKYYEMFTRYDFDLEEHIDIVVLQWHYADSPPSNWSDIVCVSSDPTFPPDPGKPGKLSPPQSGYTNIVLRDKGNTRNAVRKNDGSYVELPGDTYDAGIDQQSWNEALAPLAKVQGQANNGSAIGKWESGSGRGGGYPWVYDISHNARYGGNSWEARINDAYPNRSNLPEPAIPIWDHIQDVTSDFAWNKDLTTFPDTHLSTYEWWRFSDYPTVLDAGLKFSTTISVGLNPDSGEQYPYTVVQRIVFPSDYPDVDWDFENPVEYDAPLSTEFQIQLIWQVDGDNEWPGHMVHGSQTIIGGDTHLMLEHEVDPNITGQHNIRLRVPPWIDYFNESRTVSVYERKLPNYVQFADPVYFDGTLPPWGGVGSSLFVSNSNRVTASMNSVQWWQEVEWPPWHYWIPDGCPPHLRLTQRTDVAKGPFENIPVTPDCGKALRLMGRDVHQNLIPGKGPRVQPNSYP